MVVGMLHLQCGSSGVCGAIYAVDARDYINEITLAAARSNGTYAHPVRYCPFCEARAKQGGYESDRARDERMRE
tara:strand:+ start:3088 stop:3309 length:222 start_codon:yes stop_codon:yes gene_type:complete